MPFLRFQNQRPRQWQYHPPDRACHFCNGGKFWGGSVTNAASWIKHEPQPTTKARKPSLAKSRRTAAIASVTIFGPPIHAHEQAGIVKAIAGGEGVAHKSVSKTTLSATALAIFGNTIDMVAASDKFIVAVCPESACQILYQLVWMILSGCALPLIMACSVRLQASGTISV